MTEDPPIKYRVTFEVPKLAGIPRRTFDLRRTGPDVQVQCGETLDLVDGRATLEATSLELITLVAQTPVP